MVKKLFDKILNFGAFERKIEDININTHDIYVQMVGEHTYTYLEYLNKIAPLRDELDIEIQKMLNGEDNYPSRQVKHLWYQNLVNQYRNEKHLISRFENDVNILENLSKSSSWDNLTYGIKEIEKRYLIILNSLENSYFELTQVKKLLTEKLKLLKEHSNLSNLQSETINHEVEVMEFTLSQSYQLFDWYRDILVLQIEYWRVSNPEQSISSEDHHRHFLEKIKSLDFNIK